MVIDRCILLLTAASQQPLFMWKRSYLLTRRSLIDDLSNIHLNGLQTSPAAQTLTGFIQLLSNREPDESALAEGFMSLNEIFAATGLVDERLQTHSQLSQKFSKRVHQETAFAKLRANLKSASSADQQSYEQRLFATEGLDYCLLYYLTYYKALTDLDSAEAKNNFINQPTVNFGFGDMPGIQQDFTQDECLEKFILLILDDATRGALVREYYYWKVAILAAKGSTAIEYALHEFLFALLTAFEAHGVINAANSFFAPYGQDATILHLVAQFNADYAPQT